MVKTRAFVALVMVTTLTGSAMAGSADTRAPRPGAQQAIVADHITPFESTIRSVGHRLIFALWTFRSLGRVDFSAIGGGYQLDGIQDGNEPVGGLGKGILPPVIPPSTSNTPVR